MATTLSKKLPDMPKGNWKAWLAFSPKTTSTKEKKEKEVKPKKELKRTPLKPSTKPIKKTPLAKVGARKKARISEYGTESDFMVRVWKERVECGNLWCEVCGEEVKTPVLNEKLVKPQCFAHKLSKGMYEKFRYLKQNIAVVCSIKCHHSLDETLNDQSVRNDLEKEFDLLLKEIA